MNSYSTENFNQTGAFLRLMDAMKRAKKSRRNFAIFIGAGCSLTSSNKDIRTEHIILNCIRQSFNPQYQHPGNWEQLYRDFVNYVWSPRSEVEKRELLNDFFLYLQPGAGYKNLRLLIDNGYITDIITTNFDMLIDDSLLGLSYNVYVGTNPVRTVKGGSAINLIKVHGDIENGELRFSPSELENLPDSLSNKINNITDHSCLVCGYSGQDIGVMKSLCKKSSYSVFWSSPQKPIKDDIYESKKIYDWMEIRNSESNFIFGELGKFDELMRQLVTNLLSVQPFKTEHILWQNSSIVNALKVNQKVYHIFNDILSCNEMIFNKFKWEEKFPFFADRYETVLKAFLHYYKQSDNYMNPYFGFPENEIDALVLGVSIDVISRTSGLNVTRSSYLTQLKNKFIESNPQYRPDNNFWDALNKILAFDIETNDSIDTHIPEIQLSLNEKGLLKFCILEPQIDFLKEIIFSLYICAMFLPTYKVNNSNEDYFRKNKLLLQLAGECCEFHTNLIEFKLGTLTSTELYEIFELFFKNYKFQYNGNNSINNTHIKILANINKTKENEKEIHNLYEYIVEMCKLHTQKFMEIRSAYGFDNIEYVVTNLFDEIINFLNSNKKSMFVIGTSGSGKTSAIKNLVNIFIQQKNLLYVFTPKIWGDSAFTGLYEFFPDVFQNYSSEQEILLKIVDLLKLRNSSLILVYDGINEVNTGFTSACIHYKGLWNLTDLLYKNNVTNIKLIITCRDQIFSDYCNETGLYPDPEKCYSFSFSDEVYPYYQISTLSLETQKKLAQVYFKNLEELNNFINELENNLFLQKAFNQPYLIALASEVWSNNDSISVNFSIRNIFSCFTKQMIKRIGGKKDIFMAYKIINKYFELLFQRYPFNRRITKFQLTNSFSNDNKQIEASIILNQLSDVNIFSSLKESNYIRFSHDRIEEHLLSVFFNSTSSNFILNRAIELTSQDEIIYVAIQSYFNFCLSERQYESVLSQLDYWYGINSYTIPSLLAGCVGNLDREILIELCYFLKTNNIDLNRFICMLISGMKGNISSATLNNSDLFFENFDTIRKIFPALDLYSQEIFYIASRYYYIQENDMVKANQYCKKAENSTVVKEYLSRAVKLQKAILLKTKGNISAAIDIFEKLFLEFIEQLETDNAVECILEWGGALREQTQFTDALKVYEKINLKDLIEYPELYAKICRRVGTVYKNQMQQIIKNSLNNNRELTPEEKEDAISLYFRADNQFEEALLKISKTRDIIEKLKILSEQTENALKITPLLPEQIYKAKYCHSEEAKLLSIVPVPDKKCLYLREHAIFNDMNGEYLKALDNLIKSRDIAIEKNLFYREFEANYQIAHLIERRWNNFSKDIHLLGIEAVNRALSFNLSKENIYIMNCQITKKKLIAKAGL